MEKPSLSVSPVAELLIGLAVRRESGTLSLGQRTLQIARGELQHVSAADGDIDLSEFLVRSGRLTPEQRARLDEWASAEGLGFEHVLALSKLVPPAELRAQRRALWLDRFARSLRRSMLQPAAAAMWTSATPTHSGAPHDRVRLLPMLLDALSRIALDVDAAEIGRRLNHRMIWREAPLEAEAKRWASFGETIERPSVAALLARLPACAPQIAALVRAGFVTIAAPSAPELPADSYLATLPPPPSRLSNMPVLTWSPLPPAIPAPRTQPPRAAGPRVQLDPGSAGNAIDDIPVVEPTSWPKRQSPLQDPLREAELALLESRDASHRAELYVALAELWEARIGSLEEAARNLREAAAADPRDVLVLAQTARTCFKVGHGELALRYAATAVAASEPGAQRAEQARLLAELYESLGQPQQALATLSEAAAEHAGAAWPHEHIAQLLFEADRLQLAAAHLRCAGSAERVRDPQHALVLYALAYGWDSENPGLATEYADALDALGHPEAAIAILSQTARTLASPKRRTLQLQAAERADAHERSDLAAEILLEMASELSEENPLWPRIDQALDQPGLETERAAVLEGFVHSASPEGRARWLLRAAAALERVESESKTSLRYLWLAARRDPSRLSAAERAHLDAADPPTLRGFELDAKPQCTALEAQLKQTSEASQQRHLLAQLAALRAERADAKGVVSACLRLLSMNSERSDAGFDAVDLMAVARLWRATAALPDPVLRSEALSWLARVRTGQSQGRALALLARELEGMHDFAGALTSAESALLQDTSAADAALIALRHIHRHKPERALPLLAQAQRLLAAPPAVLFATADCAAAAGAPELQLRALEELCRKLPFLAAPRLFTLDVWLRTRDPQHIASAAEDLLAHARGPHVVRRARDAVGRLAELGKPAAAARLAERVLALQGKLDPSYADHAYALAQASEDPGLAIAALERAASAHTAGARAACLFQLAARHAATADRAAEQRALLRAAAVPAGRTRALEQLALRFAECGDLQRLLTVLSLQLDTTNEPPLRRRLLFDMACAAVGMAHDQDAAASYMRNYLQEAGDDRDALLFGLGGLFALGDEAWAYQTARAIADELPEQVGGVIYLWLAHKAELTTDTQPIALELACEGARRFSSVGELLLMAERLTLSRRDAATALSLYEELIASCTGAHGTRALHYRAGRWLEKSGLYLDALPHYQRAFELAPSAGVAFAAIERCARAGERWDVLVDTQSSLAEHTPDEGRRTTLLGAAIDNSMRELRDPLRTLEILLEAENGATVGRFDAQLLATARRLKDSSGPASDFLAQIARVRGSRIEQIWDPGVKAAALIGLARLHAQARRDDVAAALVYASVLETELAEELTPELRRDAELEYGALQPRKHKKPAAIGGDGGKDAASEETLRARAAGSGSDALAALEDLTSRVCADPGRDAEAHALLAQLVRTAPERTDALRELRTRAERAGAVAEARICAQLAAVFGEHQTSPAPLDLSNAMPESDELWRLIAPNRDPALVRLTRLIWMQARLLPQLHPASHLEALGAPFSAADPSIAGRAFNRVTKLLARRDTKLFIKVNLAPEVSALPGPPGAIVVRAGLEDRAALEFQLARAIVSCEPEHALVTALSERDARRFLRSVQAAFGPDEPDAALTRFDRALAQQLTAAVDNAPARELRELLRTHGPWLDYVALKAEAERCGARAGLFLSGDVTAALTTLARTQPALGDCDISDEAGFQRACRQSAAFAEVVRTALSAEFVELTARAMVD
jgi:hypothetical protein